MKLLIDIPEHIFKHAKESSEDSNDEFNAMRAIANGIQLLNVHDKKSLESVHYINEHKTDNTEQLKTAIKLLKNVRRELIDYNGVNNAIAQALYILIESAENSDNKKGGVDND